MNVNIGSDINLGFAFTRNNRILTGQTVTVRVVNQQTGAELLASTAVPETSEPGVYNFAWTSANPTPPPLVETDMIALFSARFQVFPVDIFVIKPRSVILSDFIAQIEDTDLIKAEISDDNELSAIMPDEDLKATIEEPEDLKASVSDEDLKGEIEC